MFMRNIWPSKEDMDYAYKAKKYIDVANKAINYCDVELKKSKDTEWSTSHIWLILDFKKSVIAIIAEETWYICWSNTKEEKLKLINRIKKLKFLDFFDFSREEQFELANASDHIFWIRVWDLPKWIYFEYNVKNDEYIFIHETGIVIVEDEKLFEDNKFLKTYDVEFKYFTKKWSKFVNKTLKYLDYRKN